ncbi:NAD(P)H-quinone oxidoreductase subunit N [Tumidithrix elongata RA019]|uniref:NAD(P)H-quinone oxidoreductase subunit 2 n=1 Tax=Tumidithrix elongata BACA0141 TaxID=2716417 RepID=A0AAW9PQY4_9CYAN|nr:NAD(P)H-quinone oxidoreductase subunit N [Tumidithrix elongata RA019]
MDLASLNALLNTGVILPELIVIVTLVAVLVVDLVSSGRQSSKSLSYIAIAGLVGSVAALVWQWTNITNPISFIGSFNGDKLSIIFRAIIAASALLTVMISERYLQQSGVVVGEYLVILLTATVGGMFLAGSDEMVMIFVALETLSIASYLLSGYTKRDPRSNEAALKYLLVGASSSAIFLYGMSLLYGLSGGETTLEAIAAKIAESGLSLIIAMVFVIAGISFKLSAVPFHQWTPDVYEGSPTPVVAFLSIGSKVAGFALALRFMLTAFPLVTAQWHYVFVVLTILSMVLGNVVAIAQTSMKRMLAYSSIGQAGFVMLGMVVGTEAGYSSMVFYLLLYLFMNMGAFACVILFALRTGTDQITEYSGLYQKDPLLTLCLSVCLLSLGGIPPLAGFFGKIYIFWAGWQAQAYGLVILALTMSVVSIYYYIRVVKMMVVKEPQEMSASVKNYPNITSGSTAWSAIGMRPLQVVLILTLVFTSLAGIASNPLFTLANQSVEGTNFLQSAAPITQPVAALTQPSAQIVVK